MSLIESLFDLLYLTLVLFLGIRLLFEGKKETNLFGLMAILLGLGDAFHLLPRVISHLSPGGFEAHSAALSWGQFVTSITMTLFYLLFFAYYRIKSGDGDPKKTWIMLLLAALRIALVLLPQNQWGSMPGNYVFGILRNIPFALMGALLIVWTYQHRKQEGLQHMSLLIFLSFAFYVPVVLFAQSFPPIGALMMPKTVAYLLIVVLGYRHYIQDFTARNLLGLSASYLVMGLVAGVFYREFTKYYAYTSPGHLGKLHSHTLVLGFILYLLFYLLLIDGDVNLSQLKRSLYLYGTGLSLSLVGILLFGIDEVVAQGQKTLSMAALSGISGLGHLLLALGLITAIYRIYHLQRPGLSR